MNKSNIELPKQNLHINTVQIFKSCVSALKNIKVVAGLYPTKFFSFCINQVKSWLWEQKIINEEHIKEILSWEATFTIYKDVFNVKSPKELLSFQTLVSIMLHPHAFIKVSLSKRDLKFINTQSLNCEDILFKCVNKRSSNLERSKIEKAHALTKSRIYFQILTCHFVNKKSF